MHYFWPLYISYHLLNSSQIFMKATLQAEKGLLLDPVKLRSWTLKDELVKEGVEDPDSMSGTTQQTQDIGPVLDRCWDTVAQYWSNTGPAHIIEGCYILGVKTHCRPVGRFGNCFPSDTRRWPNADLMLGRRRSLWPNIIPTLFQCLCLLGCTLCSLFKIHRGCAYTVLQTVQMPGECSAIYGTVHYKEPLKSFDKSRA